jgi:O-antigen/teichoic acid export membrane protein
VILALLRRALGGWAAPPDTPPVPARGWLRAALPMGAAAMLLTLDAQVGLLVLGALAGTHDAGVYAATLLCTAPFAVLISVGRMPLGGVVARLGAAGERERLQRGVRTATRAVAGLSAAATAVLLVAPEQILRLFGDDFQAGAGTLRIVAVAQLVNAVCAFNGMVLIMGGQERSAMRAALGCLLLDGALCLALVPPLGARGAAIAMLVSVTARNVANTVVARRRLGVDTTVLGRL